MKKRVMSLLMVFVMLASLLSVSAFAADDAEKLRMETEEDFNCDCGSCDYALDRFYLSRADELRIKKKGLQKSIERMQRQITEIDLELEQLAIQE